MSDQQVNNAPQRVRSFVRRGGRMGSQLESVRAEVVPQLAPGTGQWHRGELFPACRSMVLEIGSGMGEATASMAHAQPQVGIIAVEVHDRGVAALARTVRHDGLENVRIHVGDAVDALTDHVPQGTLDEIRIWFPDPWPKKRHHKRRLITPEFVDLARSRLVVGGRIHAATDHAGYAEWIEQVLRANTGLRPEVVGGPRPQWRPVTKFERTGVRAGRSISDFIFDRIN